MRKTPRHNASHLSRRIGLRQIGLVFDAQATL